MKTNKTTLGNRAIFANNLRRYLQQSGKTQREVAAAIGVTTGNFCDWVNCRSTPNAEKLQKLADYFGIAKADLVEEYTVREDYKEDQKVLELFHRVPKEKRELVLSMIQAAVDSLK